MGILSDFERRLGGAIEGIFTKAFRTGLQPVELATRILREMETNKTVGVRGVWVPNHFVFGLSPEDHERFEHSEKALRAELERVVREGAAERGWELLGAAGVELHTNPDLRQGEYTCDASLVESSTTSGARPVRPSERDDAEPATAELVLIDGGRARRTFGLSGRPLVIGRLAESDIVVSDPGASRRHAEVRPQNGRYVIADLGSTNGTLVNGSPVAERTLHPGDRIAIGSAILEFRRR